MNKGLMELVEMGEVMASVPKSKDGAVEKLELLKSSGFKSAAQIVELKFSEIKRKAGVSKAGYIVISEAKIADFLKRKVNQYNKECLIHGPDAPKKSKGLVNTLAEMTYGGSDFMQQSGSRMAYGMDSAMMRHIQMYESRMERMSLYEDTINIPINPPTSIISNCATCCVMGNTGIGKFSWNETKVEEYSGIPPENVLKAFSDHKDKKLFDYFVVASVKNIHDPIILGRFKNVSDRYFIPGTVWGEDVKLDDLI